MNKRIAVLGGAFSSGKSTLQKTIKEMSGDSVYHIEDGARALLEQRGGISDIEAKGTNALADFQLDVMEWYLREESKALRQNKPILSDGSLIEVLAYSQGILDQGVLNTLHNLVRARSQIYNVVHLRPHADLIEDDGLRHTDIAFQKIIDRRVEQIGVLHNVPRVSVTTTDLQERYKVAMFTLLHGLGYE